MYAHCAASILSSREARSSFALAAQVGTKPMMESASVCMWSVEMVKGCKYYGEGVMRGDEKWLAES